LFELSQDQLSGLSGQNRKKQSILTNRNWKSQTNKNPRRQSVKQKLDVTIQNAIGEVAILEKRNKLFERDAISIASSSSTKRLLLVLSEGDNQHLNQQQSTQEAKHDPPPPR